MSSENSYSKALYELADESKSLSHIEEQASSIINLISKSEDFEQLIKDPTIKIEEQSKIINEISNYTHNKNSNNRNRSIRTL